jgi:SNF2 family DNA or RNA helicase
MSREIYLSSADEDTWLVKSNVSYSFFSKIPERKRSEGDFSTYLVGATSTTQEVIDANVDKIHFMDRFSEIQYADIKRRTYVSERVREQTAAYKTCKVLPARYILCDDRITPFQELAAANIHVSQDGFGLFMEQGTGKTFSVITAVDNLPKGARVIVVCPNSVRYNWQREIQKFSQRNTKVEVMRGGQMKRLEKLITLMTETGQDATVCVVGYDSIQGMWEYLHMVEWDMAVLDESHMIKGPKTKRWEVVKKLRDRAKKRVVLTGTPVANTIMDLYTQLEFLYPGCSGFIDYQAFKRFFGVYEKAIGDDSRSKLVGIQNMPVMKDILSRVSFVITKKEALPDLPDKVYDVEEVEMTTEQAEAYEKLASDLMLKFEGMDDDNPLVVNNILTQLMKLAQITSGFINIPEIKDEEGETIAEKKRIHFSPNPKVERLIEILKEKGPHEKTLVWTCFTHDIERIAKACEMEGIKAVTYNGNTSIDDRLEAERAFNEDDDCKVFIGNAGAGGVGLNLLGYPPGEPDRSQCNADHAIYFSQDWNSIKRSQSEDRSHRRGTRVKIRVTDMCIIGTIDQTIRERVVEKRMGAFDITDVRAILKEIANRG